MSKKVLIISPHFPPVNAPDMHRVRQSLPFFKTYGWEATVLCVHPEHVEMAMDDMLVASVPTDVPVYIVKAFSTHYTRKLGLGNLGIRAFWHLFKKGNQLIKEEKYDLIYFSTTVFASMPLGRLWKQKFNIPFIIDMQDPWRNDYYLSLPKSDRPQKFWFAYNLNKYLEHFTMQKVDGIIAVSGAYIESLKSRYPRVNALPCSVFTFGAHSKDMEISMSLNSEFVSYALDVNCINIVYAGAVPPNMLYAIEAFFIALKKGINENSTFKQIRMHFLGTNYAVGESIKSVLKELIDRYELSDYVFEKSERLPYFQVLNLLQNSQLAVLPGTLDSNYTASKLYPYIMSKIPILAIFHKDSSVTSILKELNYGKAVAFDENTSMDVLSQNVFKDLCEFLDNGQNNSGFNGHEFKKYKSDHLTKMQCDFFNTVLNSSNQV